MPTVIEVDDFALRRGAVYGTVIVDMATRRPIDMLYGRDADTLAAWLGDRPGIEMICRDRASAYADGARRGAPAAIQLADRWHLWANLGEAVEKMVAAHRACLSEPPGESIGQAEAIPTTPERQLIDYPLARRHRERHSAIQTLLALGRSRTEIAHELGISVRTVRRFAHTTLEEHLGKAEHRASSLDHFKDHIHRRWNDGVRNAAHLHRELQALGWHGSERTVDRYIRHLRPLTAPTSSAPTPPKSRRVSGWIMSDPDHLTAHATLQLNGTLAQCPELDATRQYVASFANMIKYLKGEKLPAWIDAVQADNLPALRGFATSLTRDQDAVTAGLTLPWSNGPTEGTVNRLKMLKRSMYGRVNLDLLRRRALIT